MPKNVKIFVVTHTPVATWSDRDAPRLPRSQKRIESRNSSWSAPMIRQ